MLASDFSNNEKGMKPMMRNNLFINKKKNEEEVMVQHVLNIKRLNYQTLLCHRGSAPAADANPACHNHQPLLTK